MHKACAILRPMNTLSQPAEQLGPFKTGYTELNRLLEITEAMFLGAKGHDICFAFMDAVEEVELLMRPKTRVLFGLHSRSTRHKIRIKKRKPAISQ